MRLLPAREGLGRKAPPFLAVVFVRHLDQRRGGKPMLVWYPQGVKPLEVALQVV